MNRNTPPPTTATTLLPTIHEKLVADPDNAGDFLSIALPLLRKKQLERGDVREKLVQYAERKGVSR